MMPLFARVARSPLLEAIWLGLLSLYIVAGASLAPFHGDESTLIFMGRDYFYIFAEGDLNKVYYYGDSRANHVEQHLRLVNGTISKTIYGWLAHLRGFGIDDLNTPWSWSRDIAANVALDRVPEAGLLGAARIASSLQLALAVVVYFAFVRLTINRPAAFLASAFFALHPAILVNGRRAMMEGSLMLGLMLLLLAAAWLLRDRTSWRRYALLGICAGFAIACKHPNAFPVTLVFLACGGFTLFRYLRARGAARIAEIKALGWLAAAAVLALLFFALLNPAWWRAPDEAAIEILHQRLELLEKQVANFGGYESLAQRLDGFAHYTFVETNQYFEVDAWAHFPEITAQIESYEASGLAGVSIGGGFVAGLIELLLATLGIWLLFHDKSMRQSHRALLLTWGLGIAAITLALTPLPWLRYYLPALPFVMAMTALALIKLAETGLARIKARFDAPAGLA